MMVLAERAFVFECDGQHLVGIVHGSDPCAKEGLLVVVGGPQYRVGSHRQFLLLARYLADNGIPVMRFDYRGMGDAEGDLRTFEHVNDDIRAAIDAFFERSPGLESVVLWGLCDAASASLFYGHTDSRVSAMILLNPWVRTEAAQAKAYLRHYYVRRVMAPGFWKKLFSGMFDFRGSLNSILGFMKTSRQSGDVVTVAAEVSSSQKCQVLPLPERMLDCLGRFGGRVRIIISGDDLTAVEFMDLIKSSKDWKKVLKRKGVDFRFLNEANHTFSTRNWRDRVAEWTLEWVRGG
jgi:exosortase A-associated hydrolase 1